jgi:hypothetical protein
MSYIGLKFAFTVGLTSVKTERHQLRESDQGTVHVGVWRMSLVHLTL